MKKVIVALAAASLLLASCSGDYCKCTTKSSDGDKVTTTVARPDDGKCSDLESNGKATIAGIDINTNTTVTCKTVSDSNN